MITRRFILFCAAYALLAFSSVARGEELVVGVSEIPPCSIFTGDKISGFSIDLWEKCANELGLEYRYQRLPFADKLQSVMDGKADVAIAGITITEQRETQLDFSVPTLDSGLRIMIRADESLLPVISARSRKLILYLLAFLVLFGHILWLAERGRDAIEDRYIPGIFEAFWCVFATMSTVGYGDIAPQRWLGRLMAILIMFIGISFFGIIAATLTADLISEKKVTGITSHQDLYGLDVGTKRDTTTAEFLRELGIRLKEADSFEDAVAMLRAGQVDAVVYDQPTVLFYAKNHADVLPVGDVFNSQYYGFAFPDGSELVERVDRALLKLKESGANDTLQRKWLGEG